MDSCVYRHASLEHRAVEVNAAQTIENAKTTLGSRAQASLTEKEILYRSCHSNLIYVPCRSFFRHYGNR